MTSSRPAKDAPLSLRQALPYLLIFTGVFFVNFITRVALAPFLPHIETELGLDHAQSGGLFLFISTGMSLSMFVSGLFARALGHRRVILLSTFAIGLCMIGVASAQGIWQLRCVLFAMGAAGGLYFPSAITSITALLEPRHWGRGISIHELAPTMSFIVMPALGATLSGVVPWRVVFTGIGCLALLMGTLFALRGRGGRFKGDAPSPSVIFGQVLRRPAFWVLSLLFSMAVAASFGPYSMLALYLTDEKGMSVEHANMVLTASRLAGPFLVLVTGHLVDRIGAQRAMALSLGVCGTLTAGIGLLPGWGMIASAVAQPAMAACFFPAGLTAASNIFPKKIRNIAVSLIIPLAIFSGSGLTPPVLGWFGDQGNFATGFISLGLCILSGPFVLKLLHMGDGGAHSGGYGAR